MFQRGSTTAQSGECLSGEGLPCEFVQRQTFSPNSMDSAQTASLPSRDLTLTPSKDHEGSDIEILVQEVLSFKKGSCHPARAFILRATLNEALVGDTYPRELRDSAGAAICRINQYAGKEIPEMFASIRTGKYSRDDLRHALAHPLVSEKAIESFFSQLISRELFTRSYGEVLHYSERPSHSFGFLSFSPAAIISALNDERFTSPRSFHDLGCGLGPMMFVVALLTNATVSGTELSSEMCEKARAFASSINRADITFHQGDVLDHSQEYPPADVYYTYSPFIWKGEEMNTFVQRVEASAQINKAKVWVGDYKNLLETFAEQTSLTALRSYGRLSIYG